MRALVKTFSTATQGWLWLSVLLMPVLALAGGLGFQLAGFAIGASAAVAWAADRTRVDYLNAAWPVWLLVFMLWAWISTLWSPYDADFIGGNASVLFVLVAALLFVPLAVLKTPERFKPALIWTVIGAGFFGVALLLADAASGYGVSLWAHPPAPGEHPVFRLIQAEMNLGRGQVSYAQLLWPVAALLVFRLKYGWVLALLAFLGLIISAMLNSLSVVVPTLVLAGGIAPIAWRRPKLGLRLAFFLAMACLVLAPILGILSSLVDTDSMRQLPLSWEHRLRMWAYTWELIRQAPLIGHGFDSARFFDALKFRAPDGRDITVLSLHPHNIGLQIWLETGVVGIVLAVIFLCALLKTVLKTCTQPLHAFAAAGLVATVAISGTVTVGVWQHWWWALIVLAASLICLVSREP